MHWRNHSLRRSLCVCALAALALAACGSAPPPPARAVATPACPRQEHRGEAELLRSLPGADYDCAEELAAALALAPRPETIDRLLAMARPPSHSLARRNALRAIGRLAEQPPGSAAHRLVRQDRAADVRAALVEILSAEQHKDVLQDAIWVLDTFFLPAWEAQPLLEAISADRTRPAPLRARAMNAVSRLILTRAGPVRPSDLDFTLRALRSDEPGVRARAALILERLGEARLDDAGRARAAAALADAHAATASEPLLPQAGQGEGARGGSSGLRFDPLLSGRPDIPVPPLAARAAVARALDRYAPGARYQELLEAFTAAALPVRHEEPGLVIRSGLAPEAIPPLLDLLARARAEFFALLGANFAAPLAGDRNDTLTLLIFGDPAAYEAYMHAFVGFGAEVEGLYVEAQGTLYARDDPRRAGRLAETLAHEYAHYLAGRHIFPGGWHDPGYHAEPKGWADEGLATLIAARATGQDAAPDALCERRGQSLAALIGRRAGYDRFGTFTYDEAHALARYLLIERPEAGRRIYAAYRAGTYRQHELPQLAGLESLDALADGWQRATERWCESRGRGARRS